MLHCPDGPAVVWPDAAEYYFWRGIQVPRRAVVAAETLTASEIVGEPSVEARSVMIERFGRERFLHDLALGEVHADHYGTLWRAEAPDQEPLALVEFDLPADESLRTADPSWASLTRADSSSSVTAAMWHERYPSTRSCCARVPPALRNARDAVCTRWLRSGTRVLAGGRHRRAARSPLTTHQGPSCHERGREGSCRDDAEKRLV